MRLTLPPVPERQGAYRWVYADFSCGDLSAVVIFMLGSVFSRRYVVSDGYPSAHSAVNLAVYDKHERIVWALTEYPRVEASDTHWRIGRSSLELLQDGAIHARVDEHTLSGRRVCAELRLHPTAPPLERLSLAEATTHTWQALAPRARATLSFRGVELSGAGYADTNGGATKLGTDLARWTWSRVHSVETTEIRYAVEGGMQTLLRVRDSGVEQQTITDAQPSRRTLWGLSVPKIVHYAGDSLISAGSVVESSPFYARLHNREGDVSVLCESADFARFRAWYIRWMADYRTRYERSV